MKKSSSISLKQSQQSSSSPTNENDSITGTCTSTKTSLSDLIPHNQTKQQTEWSSMKSFLQKSLASPSDLCPEEPTSTNPKLAKDVMYAKAVLETWKQEVDDSFAKEKETIGASFPYIRTSDESTLNGYTVINADLIKGDDKKVPAVILFHTGAGPQDVFLRWKADMLARDPMWGDDNGDNKNNNGCVVLIADIVGDSTGWTWTDRDRYDDTRKKVLQRTVQEHEHSHSHENENGPIEIIAQRWKLRETVAAAVQALKNIQEVDDQNIAAMGWCLGGHPVLELGRMKLDGVHTLVTFHGVFDGIKDDIDINTSISMSGLGTETAKGQRQNCVLICNGKSDPFVSRKNLEIGKKTFEGHSWNINILDFEDVKHGFTNPAQDYNPSDAFSFNEKASGTSWDAAKQLLKKQLL
eukprot:CAMPEP_0203668976 /NCGR_PEP_ID=MMETSP0090-20130426/5458_1 /ASSEMBLY_ACC=CAM_ASM_001088 /TAXON_ID=426623 /ORGANISM="Chaetoceros affinis, Strain CCMP159" /LENGTH=409 /DNA_ID=CAMNT_0050533539 /DNA_START=140 /DNA_END=1369 /DNA_ORIENTATION=+